MAAVASGIAGVGVQVRALGVEQYTQAANQMHKYCKAVMAM